MRTRFMKITAAVLAAALLAGCSGKTEGPGEAAAPVYEAVLPSAAEKADIFVEPVEGITEHTHYPSYPVS